MNKQREKSNEESGRKRVLLDGWSFPLRKGLTKPGLSARNRGSAPVLERKQGLLEKGGRHQIQQKLSRPQKQKRNWESGVLELRNGGGGIGKNEGRGRGESGKKRFVRLF
ncbi:hypothetical protein ACLOJK_032637 [Asimina triloba]